MIRKRSELLRGTIWNHIMQGSDALYIALSVDDSNSLGRRSSEHQLWSITLSPLNCCGLVWSRTTDNCVVFPPHTWSPATYDAVIRGTDWAAQRGVFLTPLCWRLYAGDQDAGGQAVQGLSQGGAGAQVR
jgi:hypothetical protein